MSGLFGNKKPTMQTVQDPAPLPDEEALKMARRRTIAKETKTYGATAQRLVGGRETLG